jgi:hypothetical protein
MTRRRRLAIGLGLLVAVALGALAARAWLAPRSSVVIGTSFAAAGATAPVLRPGQPFRALISLGRPFGGDGRFVDLELHHVGDGGDRTVRLIPIAVRPSDDEAMFAVADVVHLVGPLRGDFRVVFARAGRVLGAGRFTVAR